MSAEKSFRTKSGLEAYLREGWVFVEAAGKSCVTKSGLGAYLGEGWGVCGGRREELWD